jgi:hypothetical protein
MGRKLKVVLDDSYMYKKINETDAEYDMRMADWREDWDKRATPEEKREVAELLEDLPAFINRKKS